MSFDCSFCNFTAPTRARYMRHLGTQKHARNYLEGTKHLIKDKTNRSNVQEEVEENIWEGPVQEEETTENPIFSEKNFLDMDTIKLFKTMTQTIELSPLFIWIMTLFNRFKYIIPQKSTIESENEDSSDNIVLGQ